MGRKKCFTGSTGKTKTVSVTLSEELLATIEANIDKGREGQTSRSEILELAGRKFLTSRTCVHCHEIVPNDAQYCCYCGKELTLSLQDRRDAVYFYKMDNPEYQDTDEFLYHIQLTDSEILSILNGEKIKELKNKPIKINRKEEEENRKKRIDEFKRKREERERKRLEDRYRERQLKSGVESRQEDTLL